MEKVSIYIPCFNAEKTISRCVESVLKQDYPVKEVLVIDDGSADKTADIVSRYPVRIISHDSNKGLAAARNTAIKNTETTFIAAVDADCSLESDWLTKTMRSFYLPDLAGIGGRVSEMYTLSAPDLWRSVHMKQDWDDVLNQPSFLFGSNVIFRRKALLDVGLYNEDLKNNYEDVDICARLKRMGYLIRYESSAVVYHLKQDTTFSVLNNFWNWYFAYNREKGFFSDQEHLLLKIKDNLGLANRFIEQDIAAGRSQLLYLDFLLGAHHTLKDFEYFTRNKSGMQHKEYSRLSGWLVLIDLSFSCHFSSAKENLYTLLGDKEYLLQNLFAANLVLGEISRHKFSNQLFQRKLRQHLHFSIATQKDDSLLDALENLINLHQGWDRLFCKRHPHLNSLFLQKLSFYFKEWLDSLGQKTSSIESSFKSVDDNVPNEEYDN